MNCEQAEELLGAYALDALPAEEAASFRAHIANCPDHAARAAELRATASTLAATVDDVAPPPRLRARIADAVAATAEAPAPAPSRLVDLDSRRAPSSRFAGLAAPAWGAIAAVLAIAVAGLIAWNVALQGGSTSDARVQAVTMLQQDTGATAGFVVVFDDGSASVVADALPRLDTAQVYQLWSLDESGQATSLGLMQYDDRGVANADITLDGDNTRTVAITIEPAGGSDQPTTAPLYLAEI